MKTRQDNEFVNRISALYTENDTELSWLIELGSVCDDY